MIEVLKALSESPMTAPVLARTTGLDIDSLGDIVSGLIGQDLIEEDGNKLAVTSAGKKALAMASGTESIPPSGSLMELGDDAQPEVKPHDLLPFIADAKSPKAISEQSGLPRSRVQSLLTKLRAEGLAVLKSNGYWKSVTPGTAKSIQKQAQAKEPTEEIIEIDIPAEIERSFIQVPNDLETAFASLSSALMPRQIQNLPTKLAVLERLSELLDPSIATVLSEIQNDLQKAA